MAKADDQPSGRTSYLVGDQWVLTVYSRRMAPDNPGTWNSEQIKILATYDSTEFWNRRFWSMFPKDMATLLKCMQGNDGIQVSTTFPFGPTVSLKERYGNFSLAKIRRVAKHWRFSKKTPPSDLREIIAAYESYQMVYDEQYRSAWQELMERRLPRPPAPSYWYNYTGGLIFIEFFFRLWHPQLGYPPSPE